MTAPTSLHHPRFPGWIYAGNARESATLLPGADIEEGALRR